MKEFIKKENIVKRKIILSILLGLLGLLGLFYFSRVEMIYNRSFIVYLMWGFSFSLFILLLYGYKYGLLAASIGLIALFSKGVGWSSLVIIAFYVGFYLYCGLVETLYKKTNKPYFHPLIANFYYAIVAGLCFYLLYPIAISFNPPPWTNNTITSMSNEQSFSHMTSTYIILSFCYLLAVCLSRIIDVRKFLGISYAKIPKKNLLIFIMSIVINILIWIIYLVFSQIYILNIFLDTEIIFATNCLIVVCLLVMLVNTLFVVFYIMKYEQRNDITSKLKAIESRIQSINNNLQNAIIFQVIVPLNKKSEFLYISDTVVPIFGINSEDILKNPTLILDRIHKDEKIKFLENINMASEVQEHISFEIRMKIHDKSYRWMSISATPKKLGAGNTLWDAVLLDVNDIKENQIRVDYLNKHDYLTGLYNRRYYELMLDKLNTQEYMPLSLAMADVNGLKITNDAFGHIAGDQLLSRAAKIIQRSCRKDDVVARIGGDEFVILMPNTTEDECNKIIESIKEKISLEPNHNTVLSVSFGVDTKFDIDTSVSRVFMQAENRMYHNKIAEGNVMRSETILNIMNTLHELSEYEKDHCKNVSDLCVAIGRALRMSSTDLEDLKIAGFFHDIGNISVPADIIDKKGSLNDYEWVEVKKHSETGYHILRSSTKFARISEFVLYHHERFDGEGYHKGMQGENIPIQSRILTIADAYDSMSRERPYHPRLSKEDVIQELQRGASKQFDAEIVDVFINQVLGKGMIDENITIS